jgi:CDP-glucose 4,6-dehydratase
MFNNIFENRRVLVTGHSGFKGSWLTAWLQLMGAKVTGISLPPEQGVPSHWSSLALDVESHYIDIRNEDELRKAIKQVRPEIIFHLAAQSLVRRSYNQPLETWGTNVMGTANLLNCCRDIDCLAAILVVTTDKCYQNQEWVWGYRESDPLGGHDPYSASKAGTELVAESFRSSYFNSPSSPLLATARAGNVIGGGDWSEDRLVPDLVRSVQLGKALEIRSPNATRPWQHVMECLSGYLLLGNKLLAGEKTYANAWNFGPEKSGNRTVVDVLGSIKSYWPAVDWYCSDTVQPHEAQLLYLDSSMAHEKLGWKPVWSFDQGIKATAEWYQNWLEKDELISSNQLLSYIQSAESQDMTWI